MADRLESDTVLLNVSGGRPLPDDPPGLAVFSPSRRSARGRDKDLLYLCLSLRSRGPITPERYAELLNLAATVFYGSAGSVTAALRQAVGAVNQNLLDHNLREAAGGRPVQGGLIAAALRGTDFYAVQCGPGRVIAAHALSVERFPNLPSRPLGLSNTLDAHYFHTEVKEGEYFCLSAQAPAGWDAPTLAGLGGLGTLTLVAERLLASTADDFVALVGRFEPAGSVTAGLPAPTAPATSAPRPSPFASPAAALTGPIRTGLDSLTAMLRRRPEPEAEAIDEEPEAEAPPPMPAPRAAPDVEPAEAFAPPAEALEDVPPSPAVAGIEPAADIPDEPESYLEPEPAAPGTDWSSLLRRAERLGEQEPVPSLPIIDAMAAAAEQPAPVASRSKSKAAAEMAANLGQAVGGRVNRGLRSVGRAFGVTLTEASRGLRVLAARMLPEGVMQQQGMLAVPASVQIGIALVIPLLVVATAAFLYFQRGRAEQFTDTLSQAQLEVATARASPDSLSARPHWEAALSWLAQAEQLRAGDGTVAALRQEAQGKVDALDWVTRLDYRPLVVGGLGRNVQVTRLLLIGKEVYALDGAHNRVLRVVPSANNTGYIVDDEFECASGQIGPLRIGELLDLSLVPAPNVMGQDAIVALDSVGGLLYCAPGAKPLAAYLPAPDTGWIRPATMAVYADRLYVLDPGGNEVWQFLASGGAFNQPPARYFTSVAYDWQDAISFSIAGGDLLLLRRDGRVAHCSRAASGAPATCTVAAQFSDPREGRAPGERLTDVTAPARLLYDPPPEPSLYLLDRNTSALYQLSLKLALVRQYRPRSPLPAPISAVVIDPAKQFYVGAGDNIYFAARP